MNFNYLVLLLFLNTKIDALKPIHLTIVICGDRYKINKLMEVLLFSSVLFLFVRLEEALNALKSSLIFTPPPVIFHIFTEDHLRVQLKEKVTFLI